MKKTFDNNRFGLMAAKGSLHTGWLLSTIHDMSLWFFECLCLWVFGAFVILKTNFLPSATLSQLNAAPKAPALIPVRTNWPRDFDPTTLQRTNRFGKVTFDRSVWIWNPLTTWSRRSVITASVTILPWNAQPNHHHDYDRHNHHHRHHHDHDPYHPSM